MSTTGAESVAGCSSPSKTMNEDSHVDEQIDVIYRADSRRILATLIRLLGDFELSNSLAHTRNSLAPTHRS